MWHRSVLRSYFNKKHASAIILLFVVSIFVLILPSSDHPPVGKDESDNVLKTTTFDTLENATQRVFDISNKYEEMDRYFVTLKNANETCFREKRMANNLSTVVRQFSGKLNQFFHLLSNGYPPKSEPPYVSIKRIWVFLRKKA